MKRTKTISIWLDEELANIFCFFNLKTNNVLFQHQLRSCFLKHNITAFSIHSQLEITSQLFNDVKTITNFLSSISIRIKHLNNKIKYFSEALDFLRDYH